MNPQLDGILTRMYHDPATGFRPAEGFYNLLPSRLKARVSLDELTAWVDKQEVRQQFRRPTIRYTHIRAPTTGYLQIDLADMSKWSKFNKKYTFILVVIDLFSRKLWLEPLKYKEGLEVAAAFVRILEDMIDKKHGVTHITADKGTEFSNKYMDAILYTYNIKIHLVDPLDTKRPGGGRKTGVVDRVIRTVWRLFAHVWEVEKNREWYSILPDIVLNYNTRYHRTIKATPADVWGGKSVPADIETDPKQKPFAIGDRVRHVKQRRFFGKGGAEWSKEIYVVSGRLGNRYSIATSLDAEDESVQYRAYELQKTGDDVVPSGSPANPDLIAEIEAVPAERRQRHFLAREHIDADNVVEGPRVRRKTYQARE